VDFVADVQRVTLGQNAAVFLKPALQFAAIRVDRPEDGAAITAGSAITAPNVIHFQETLSASSMFFFRRGIGYRLTAGSFVWVEGTLYTAFRSLGHVLPPEELVFNPTNDTSDVCYFPLVGGKALPISQVDSIKYVVIGMGNLSATMEWRPAARAFNDPLARGAWTDLDSWHNPQAINFAANTGAVALTALSITTKQWLELALAVRKSQTGDSNSRCIFHVIPALKYQ
jgi:hypothetical protein